MSRFRTLGATLTVTPFIVVVIVVARLLVVSDYRTSTALGLASATSAGSTLVGALIPVLATALPLVTLVLAAVSVLGVLVAAFPLSGKAMIAAVTCFAATVLVTPTSTPVDDAWTLMLDNAFLVLAYLFRINAIFAFPFVFLAYSIIRDFQIKRTTSTSSKIAGGGSRTMNRVLAALVAGGGALIVLTPTTLTVYPPPAEIANLPITLRRMWLPPESVSLQDGGAAVGYVLSSDETWTTLLLEEPRSLAVYRTESVASRVMCELGTSRDGVPLVSSGRRPAAALECSAFSPARTPTLATPGPPTLER